MSLAELQALERSSAIPTYVRGPVEFVEPADPLKFIDRKAYKDRLEAEQRKTGRPDAV